MEQRPTNSASEDLNRARIEAKVKLISTVSTALGSALEAKLLKTKGHYWSAIPSEQLSWETTFALDDTKEDLESAANANNLIRDDMTRVLKTVLESFEFRTREPEPEDVELAKITLDEGYSTGALVVLDSRGEKVALLEVACKLDQRETGPNHAHEWTGRGQMKFRIIE